MACDWSTNDNLNKITLRSVSGGELINNINRMLTPRSYTGIYTTTSQKDVIASTASPQGTAIANSVAFTILNINADTNAVADETMKGTVTGSFTINDYVLGTGGNNTSTNIYLGTYSDTLHFKLVMQ